MQTLKVETKKVNNPLLTGGILLAVAAAVSTVLMIIVVPETIKYKLFGWNFYIMSADFLLTAAIAGFAVAAAFKPENIKHLGDVLFLGALLTAGVMGITAHLNGGVSALDTYYIFRDVMLILGYVLFGIYALGRKTAVIFAAIFITLAGLSSLWHNVAVLGVVLTLNVHISAVLSPIIEIFLSLGILVVVWTCCAYCPYQVKDKDVIKKNIVRSVVLSIVTLGVYAVFWVKSLTEDISKVEGVEVNSSLETALFFIIPFYALYWLYVNGKKTAKLSEGADMSVLFVIQGFFFLGLFSMALMQEQVHKAVGMK